MLATNCEHIHDKYKLLTKSIKEIKQLEPCEDKFDYFVHWPKTTRLA